MSPATPSQLSSAPEVAPLIYIGLGEGQIVLLTVLGNVLKLTPAAARNVARALELYAGLAEMPADIVGES